MMLFACLHKQPWMYRCRTGAGVMLITSCLRWVMVLQSLGVHSSISVRPAALLRHHGRGLIQSFPLHSSHFHPERLKKASRDVIVSLINDGVYRWRRRGFHQLFFLLMMKETFWVDDGVIQNTVSLRICCFWAFHLIFWFWSHCPSWPVTLQADYFLSSLSFTQFVRCKKLRLCRRKCS